MKYALVLILAVLMQACGRAPEIHTEAKPYVDRFQSIYQKSVWVSVTIVESLPAELDGDCSPSTGEVRLSKRYWNVATDELRERLVFHELGHCILGRGHDNALDKEGQPVSYMHAFKAPSSWYIRDKLSEYRSELIRNAGF